MRFRRRPRGAAKRTQLSGSCFLLSVSLCFGFVCNALRLYAVTFSAASVNVAEFRCVFLRFRSPGCAVFVYLKLVWQSTMSRAVRVFCLLLRLANMLMLAARR